jgi:hypothetical protein
MFLIKKFWRFAFAIKILFIILRITALQKRKALLKCGQNFGKNRTAKSHGKVASVATRAFYLFSTLPSDRRRRRGRGCRCCCLPRYHNFGYRLSISADFISSSPFYRVRPT